MAFASAIKYYATSTNDAIDKFKDTAVAAGWSLYDDLTGGSPYGYVITSSGTAGTDMPMYLHIYDGTNKIMFLNYVDWDNSTHTGNIRVASNIYSSLSSFNSSSFYIWCSATEDSIVFNTYVSSTHRAIWVGLVNTLETTPPLGILQSGASSGSDVNLSLGTGEHAGFVVGRDYQIIDTDNRQPVEVSSVGTNQITVSSLSYNFSAGARVGSMPYRWAVHRMDNSYVWTLRHDISGSSDQGPYEQGSVNYSILSQTSMDPDGRTGMYPMWSWIFYDYNGSGFAGYVPVNDHTTALRCYINTSKELPVSVGNLDVGTSTGSNTTTTLNDTGKSWTTNAYANKVLVMTGGLGEGQFRTISSNTSTTLTVSPAFTTTPNGSSDYTICEEGWQYLYIANGHSYSAALRML